MGVINSRKASPPKRLLLRARPNAAIVAISTVISAVATPIPNKRSVAPTQRGDCR